jgi:hypothetical protein
MSIDLRTCVAGQKLISCHGIVLTYLRRQDCPTFGHRVQYPNGSTGTRTHDGQCFIKNKLPADHDIVAIVPLSANIKTLETLSNKVFELETSLDSLKYALKIEAARFYP